MTHARKKNILAQEDVTIETMMHCLVDFERNEGDTKKDIINRHTKAGQARHEKKSRNTPEYNRCCVIGIGTEPTRGDIAEYVMATLYEKLMKMLLNRRRCIN